MLLTKIVLIKWHTSNKKYYINKGYEFTNYGDEFEVKVEDLTDGNGVKVYIKCDNEKCNDPYLKPLPFRRYKKRLMTDGKYYCTFCMNKLFRYDKRRLNKLSKGISFEKWCIENNRQDVLDRWDYELNKLNPNEINYSSNTKYYFKCPRDIHDSELKDITRVTRDNLLIKCNKCNSFEQWCLDNNRQDVLNKWDYELNKFKPDEINHGVGKYWFKCEKGIHDSELKNINSFIENHEGSIQCNACNSIAQWGIDNIGKDFLEKYWDYEKNKLDPFQKSKGSAFPKIYIFCREDESHGSYPIFARDFTYGTRCPVCQFSKGEIKISNFLTYNNWECIKQEEFYKLFNKNSKDNYFIPQKTFDALVGIGGGNLSYDFFLPKYNLLIEYQGEQHEKYIPGFHKNKQYFKRQQEHDRRKKEYALKGGYNFLEIWYWNYDNIETILYDYFNWI